MEKLINTISQMNKMRIKYDAFDEGDQVRFTFKSVDNEYMVITEQDDVHVNQVQNLTDKQTKVYLDRVRYMQMCEYVVQRNTNQKLEFDIRGENKVDTVKMYDDHYWFEVDGVWEPKRKMTRREYDYEVRKFIDECNLVQQDLHEIEDRHFTKEQLEKKRFLLEINHKL